jgi:hypothetical protein
MSINRSEKIQPNYIINEFIAISGVAKAEEINYAEIQPIHVNRIKTILAPNCQDIRNDINAKFREENGKEIGLKIACGYRSKKWDIVQGRSGNGQHPEALAVDILPIGCKNDNMPCVHDVSKDPIDMPDDHLLQLVKADGVLAFGKVGRTQKDVNSLNRSRNILFKVVD